MCNSICDYDYSVYELIVKASCDQELELANIAWLSHSVWSFTVYDPWSVLMYDTKIFTLCVHSHKPIHMSLSQTSLSLNFNVVSYRPLTNKPCH